MLDHIRDFLSRRRQAYARVFDRDDDPLGDKAVVINDLMKFCRFDQTAFHPNQRATDVMLGRQDVLIRILDYANLDIETLYEKYNTDKFKPKMKAGTDVS